MVHVRHHVEDVLLASHSLGSMVVMLQQCVYGKRSKTGLVRVPFYVVLTCPPSIITTCGRTSSTTCRPSSVL